jgi:hypothetical protein
VLLASRDAPPRFDPAVADFSLVGPIRFADMDGDGRLDVLGTSTSWVRTVAIVLGDGRGSFLSRIVPVGSAVANFAVGDFDGDFRNDLATIGEDAVVHVILHLK